MEKQRSGVGNLKPFAAGQSGNPAGRPKGSRNRLAEAFLADFCAEWEARGKKALQDVAENDPSTFVRAAVALIPKQVEIDAQQTLYVIGDRHLSADEWERKYAAPKDHLEPAARPAKRAH